MTVGPGREKQLVEGVVAEGCAHARRSCGFGARREAAAGAAEQERTARGALREAYGEVDGRRTAHGELARRAAELASRLAALEERSQRLTAEIEDGEGALAQTRRDWDDLPDLDAARARQAELRADLADQGVADASVTAVDEGVTITLENVQFPPNSARLVPLERDKLRRIGEILARFPNRDVLITGHTARVGTEESSQVLSEERARAVGDYLLQLGGRTADSMAFRGLGSRRPLADNTTEAGRRRNRRVEITILEN